MTGGIRSVTTIIFGAVLLVGAATAGAQAAGQFAIPRFVIGGGGGMGLSGGQFGLSATAGQPVAGSIGGGRFGLVTGFQSAGAARSSTGKTVVIPAAVVRYQGGW